MVCLPIQDCRQVTVTGEKVLAKRFVRMFPACEACMSFE